MDLYRVIVVSSVRLFRDGLAELVSRGDRMPTALVAANVREARPLIDGVGRAVVLLDASEHDVIESARQLAVIDAVDAVIAFASADDEDMRLALAEAGVLGYVSRDGSIDELLAAVSDACRGELVCSPSLAGALARRLSRVARFGAEADAPAERLTFRERTLVRLVDEGKSNKEIAQALHIEVATVKNHIHHILRKLGVQRRGEAAALLRWHADTRVARSTRAARADHSAPPP